MQAAPGHDVGLAAEDFGGALLHVHQLEQAELAAGVIEKQIDVRIRARVATRGRTEQMQMVDAELLQLGRMILELGDGFVAVHLGPLAQARPRCIRDGGPDTVRARRCWRAWAAISDPDRGDAP